MTQHERYSEPWYRNKLAVSGVPEHMRDGIVNYLVHGIEPGSFYRAVLENDLREACLRADDTNQRALYQHVAFLYNYAPIAAWGSPVEVADWITSHQARREAARA